MMWHRCHSFKEAFDLKPTSGLQSHLMQVRALPGKDALRTRRLDPLCALC
jgi:hypothetical protein